ncbi:hypothetical protein UFOVP97_29 [uncultured Caudovirales phage]|uniref:Uncharacterized protein n=1 Tax=uncultured Caudovirales phage TaxID=2100421 RepID=A0A6J5L258_9CAUD|nr:hypothetical protein UFOVP97_29 [uncultured Caudovirales phage]CAB4134352.1 hypothetical protein UFOVP268_47 [uncultured Caudovirales phage]
MPVPLWAAFGASALQNPDIQRGLYNAGSSVLGGLGRGTDYLARGAGGLAQQAGTGIADVLGGLGEQYLPQSVNTFGGYGRRGLGAIGSGIGGLYNAVAGNNQPQMGGQQMPGMGQGMPGGMGGMQMGPERQLQQQYQQMLGQPYNYQNQANQLLNQYQQYTTPNINRMFANAGGMGAGAQNRALSSAHTNLLTNLGALGEQNTTQRRQDIGNYLLGQQGIGLGQRRLAQEGGIANQQEALRQLGLMGGYAQQGQQNYISQLVNAINAQGAVGQVGQGNPYQQVYQQPQGAGFWNILPGLVNTGAAAAKTAAAFM